MDKVKVRFLLNKGSAKAGDEDYYDSAIAEALISDGFAEAVWVKAVDKQTKIVYTSVRASNSNGNADTPLSISGTPETK